MARDDPQVNFRIPADLKAKLEVEAKANGRTLTAEIVARLQGPSAIESLKEQMDKNTFEINYRFARFGMKAFLTAAQMVIDDASETLRSTKSFQFLHQVAAATRIPPELPMRRPSVVHDVSPEALQRVIDDLNKATKEFNVEAGAKTGNVES